MKPSETSTTVDNRLRGIECPRVTYATRHDGSAARNPGRQYTHRVRTKGSGPWWSITGVARWSSTVWKLVTKNDAAGTLAGLIHAACARPLLRLQCRRRTEGAPVSRRRIYGNNDNGETGWIFLANSGSARSIGHAARRQPAITSTIISCIIHYHGISLGFFANVDEGKEFTRADRS